MYTENEALISKICPQSISNGHVHTCFGSSCAVWKWQHKHQYINVPYGGPKVSIKELPKEEWIGYCGLSNKP